MSLQLAAQHLASKGRGKDSRLVHMTPNELKGLQALAKAKGGSLTINPETGLPEAGFLEDVLPIAATAATMFFAPQLAPTIGSSLFGATAGSALATGLGAGLMAGGYSLLGQALGGQGINVGKALTSGAVTGLGAGALQGLGAYTPTSDVVTQTAATSNVPIVPAQIAAENQALIQNAVNPATGLPYAETSLAGSSAPSQAAAEAASKTATGLSGNKLLGYGLAGAAGLSLLGSMGQKKIPTQPTSPSYIRPYTYTSTPTTPTGTYPSPYATTQYDEAGNPIIDTRERDYFTQTYTALPPYQAAQGGLMAAGGTVERMSAMDQSMGMYPQGMMDKTYYATPSQRPASMEVVRSDYDTPVNSMTGLPPIRMADGGETSQQVDQQPAMTLDEYIKTQILTKAPGSANAYTYDPVKQQYSQGASSIDASTIPSGFNPLVIQAYQAENPNQFRYDPVKQRYSSPMPTQDQYGAYLSDLERRNQEMSMQGLGGTLGFSGYAAGGQAGGEYNLGSYSDGGRLLRGPGDGMSDNIPATIGRKQPARLADGEFVVPADVVSHLGNGSTDAGAKRLYAMMDKVRKARTGTKKQGKEIKAEKYIPA